MAAGTPKAGAMPHLKTAARLDLGSATQFWSHLVVTDDLGQRTSLPVFVQF